MTTALVFYHTSVLLGEALDALRVSPGGRYVDATIGEGSHAEAILAASCPGGELLGIDADPRALETAQRRLERYAGSFYLVNGNFANLETICRHYQFILVQGLLFDLGLSSLQLEGENRGFSFQRDEPLDMRFDPRHEITAADLLNTCAEEELAHLLQEYGEEPQNRRIARAIVQSRPLETTGQLVAVIKRAVGWRRGRLHPATRTFQALRIAVNRELDCLKEALGQVPALLAPGGRLVVISYHSLEDRLVKEFLRHESRDCLCPPALPVCRCGHHATLKIVTSKVVRPSPHERQVNPRSRSARLRAAEHL